MGSGSARTLRCVRIFLTVTGSVMVASTRILGTRLMCLRSLVHPLYLPFATFGRPKRRDWRYAAALLGSIALAGQVVGFFIGVSPLHRDTMPPFAASRTRR